MKRLLCTLCLASTLAASGPATAADPVPYPGGYRTWAHVKSLIILPDHPLADPFAGLHHVYADDKALAGVQGGAFADGSTLVFDLLETESGEGAIGEGKRKFIGVMVKDEARYGATGGWGYEVFAEGSPDRRLVEDGGASCHACHAKARDTGYVYSRWRP